MDLDCASHGLAITNNMFKHKVVHKCNWYQNALDQILMIKFVVVSSDLWLHVLDTQCLAEAPVHEVLNSHLWREFPLHEHEMFQQLLDENDL